MRISARKNIEKKLDVQENERNEEKKRKEKLCTSGAAMWGFWVKEKLCV